MDPWRKNWGKGCHQIKNPQKLRFCHFQWVTSSTCATMLEFHINLSTFHVHCFRWTFHLYDLNGDGVITKDEMEDVTASVKLTFKFSPSSSIPTLVTIQTDRWFLIQSQIDHIKPYMELRYKSSTRCTSWWGSTQSGTDAIRWNIY